jgi:hypothetical protein
VTTTCLPTWRNGWDHSASTMSSWKVSKCGWAHRQQISLTQEHKNLFSETMNASILVVTTLESCLSRYLFFVYTTFFLVASSVNSSPEVTFRTALVYTSLLPRVQLIQYSHPILGQDHQLQHSWLPYLKVLMKTANFFFCFPQLSINETMNIITSYKESYFCALLTQLEQVYWSDDKTVPKFFLCFLLASAETYKTTMFHSVALLLSI